MAEPALVNAWLIGYRTNFVWVEDAASIAQWGRVEAYRAIGDVDSIDVAVAVGNTLLATSAQPRQTVRAEVRVTGAGDVPGDAYDVFDTVAAGPLGSLDVARLAWAQDGDRLRVMPEFDTPSALGAAATARAVERIIVENGGRGGASAKALDAGTQVRPGKVGEKTIPAWSWNAATDLGSPTQDWQTYKVTEPCRLYEWLVTADGGTGTSVFEFRVNGVHNGLLNISLPAGGAKQTVSVPLYGYTVLRKNATLTVRCSTNGQHTNGSVQFRAADIL